MVTLRPMLFIFMVSVAGCEAVDHFRLDHAMERYKSSCAGNTTIGCETQLVETNILTLEQFRRAADTQKDELLGLSGDKGFQRFINAIDEQIDLQQSLKPNAFVDWFLPDSPGTNKTSNALITPAFYTQLRARAVEEQERISSQEMAANQQFGSLADINSPNYGRWEAMNATMNMSIWPQ